MSLDGVNLGSAYGNIILRDNAEEVVSGAQQAFDRGISGMGQRMQAFGDQLTGLGARMTAITAPVTLFGGAAIKAASDFDSAMQEISARTGIVGDDLETIREFALQMGADTAFSAQQAADAFLQLLSSGQNAEEAMATLPVVLDAAAASGEDLGRTADTITDILAAFGLGVDDATSVVNSLARASASSSADMASLGQGFANVGPVARQFGLSVDQTAATLAIFSENGIKGAEAGTQLRSMLLNMSRDTDSVQSAWDTLGTSLFDAEGNIRNLDVVLEEMSVSLETMPLEEQNRLLTELGGSYGVMGLTALTSGQRISEMQGIMSEQASAAEIAEKRMEAFSGVVDSLQGSIETLMIRAFTPFMNNVLRPFLQQVTQVINKVSAWAEENPELTQRIITFGAALAAIGPVLVGLGIAIGAAGTALGAIGAVIGVVLSPIGLLIGAVAALGVAFATDFMGIRTAAGGVIDFLRAKFDEFRGFIEQRVMPGIDIIRQWFVEDALPAVVSFVRDTALPGIRKVFDFLAGAWAIVSPSLVAFVDWFTITALPAVLNFITTTVIPGVQGFIDTLIKIWNDVSPFLLQLFDWFVNTSLPMVVAFVRDTVMPVVQDFINLLASIWEVISPHLQNLYDWFITTALPEVMAFIQGPFTEAFQALIDFLSGLWDAVSDGLTTFADNFEQIFADVLGFVNDVIEAIGGIVGAVSDALDALSGLNTTGEGAGGLFGSGIGPNFDPIGGIRTIGRDAGGPGVAGTPYLIGTGAQPELFIPQASGQFIPNADRLLESALSAGGESVVFEPGSVIIQANSAAGGRAAADAFSVRFKEEMQRRGRR